jgi:hypothetical protein
MSDGQKKPRRKRLIRTLAPIIVLCSYFAVHRATGHYDWELVANDLGQPRAQVRRRHWFNNKPLPRWVESFFRPASQFNDWIEYLPKGPAFDPAPTDEPNPTQFC